MICVCVLRKKGAEQTFGKFCQEFSKIGSLKNTSMCAVIVCVCVAGNGSIAHFRDVLSRILGNGSTKTKTCMCAVIVCVCYGWKGSRADFRDVWSRIFESRLCKKGN